MAFEALPQQLRDCPQWLLWKYVWDVARGKWTKVPVNARTGYNASTDKPADWSAFEVAHAAAIKHAPSYGLGFVFGYASGISGIDLDGVLAEDGTVLDHNAVAIAKRFDSYTELSPSRTGLHTLILANLPSGRRFGNVEVYGQGRFFTVTGESYGPPLPIADRQEDATQLIADIDAKRQQAAPVPVDWSIKATKSDAAVFNAACMAANGIKFRELWDGMWPNHYPSASEADIAIINILAYYSDSPTQVHYIFLQSPAYRPQKYGARQHLVHDMIGRAWDKKPPTLVAIPELGIQKIYQEPIVNEADDVDDEEKAERKDNPYVLPPHGGLVASIAQFIYDQAPYPLKEAALSASLALMAGIVGRQYQFNGKGLNLYIMLLANTGSGKEAMSTGIGKIMDAVCNPPVILDRLPTTADIGFPAARGFRGPARLTGKGLMTSLAKSDTLSFVSILTEFAYTLDQMKEGSHNVGQQDMRQSLLDLYMKSSAGNQFAGHVTADKDTTIKSIASPAFTMLAESTPSKLYGYLDQDMITSGLLPRMLIIETAEIVETYNANHASVVVPPQIVADIAALCRRVLDMKATHDRRIEVAYTEDGKNRAEMFRQYCRARLKNGVADDATRELWNRGHLNAERIAAVAAIGVNQSHPVVDAALFNWAARIVHKQIIMLVGKFKRGEMGQVGDSDERSQLDVLRAIIDEYRSMTPDTIPASYGNNAKDARAAGAISYKFLYRRASRNVKFYADKRRGMKAALRDSIEALRRTGELGPPANVEGHYGEYYKLI